MHPVRCLIYGGTSSIVATLLQKAPRRIEFTLLSRVTEDVNKNQYLRDCVSLRPSTTRVVSYDPKLAYETIEKLDYDVVLVLTTHPDPKVLAAIEKPILFIGSGSVTDAGLGISKWTDYSLGKKWPERFATLTLRCGFFIPDIEGNYVIPPAGIGMDSAKRIFSGSETPDPEWLQKKMYVTPVSFLIETIFDWITTDCKVRLSGVFHFGTQHPLSRAFLRTKADLTPEASVLEAIQPVYEEQWKKSKRVLKNVPDTVVDVGDACKRAKTWIEGIK